MAVAPSHVARRMRRSVGLPERDGVLVRGVEDGSLAAEAGIEAGDLLVEAGDRPLTDADDLFAALGALELPFDLKLVRGAEERTVRIGGGAAAHRRLNAATTALDGSSSTAWVSRLRQAASRSASAASDRARIEAARRPAFWALPMATVATGIPFGIWTIDRSESSPPRCSVGIGTPITGRAVLAASMPGRWAAPPAPATITRIPRAAAVSA